MMTSMQSRMICLWLLLGSGASAMEMRRAVSASKIGESSSSEPSTWSRGAQASPLGVEEVAWALRWTGEVNRRLLSNAPPQDSEDAGWLVPASAAAAASSSLRDRLLVRGGETGTVSATKQSGLSLFHAKHPRRNGKSGAERWGPALAGFLQRALQILDSDCTDEQLLSTALLYLDRATSVSTPRSEGAAAPLPFCTPQTVHRLSLTALALAAAQQGEAAAVERLADALGVPELPTLLLQMKQALGDYGTLVLPGQLEAIAQQWCHSPILAQLQQQQPRAAAAAC